MRFQEMKIIEPILRALSDKNYKEPTKIQEEAIPLILKRKDILGTAQTGTGKTAAFAVPIIQLVHRIETGRGQKPTIRALIVTPTRELALQIDENIKAYSKYTTVKHTVVFGGVNQNSQVKKLKKGVHILVATPGRLLDLVGQGYIRLDTIKIFVLDEADRMLDMGFIHDIKKLLNLIPDNRQSLFFSATLPDNIIKLSKKILDNPIKIAVNPVSSTAATVQQFLYYTNRTSKKDLLIHLLKNREMEQVLLFARTKRGADKICRFLVGKRIKSAAIHGNKNQNHRQKTLKKFQDKELRVLVATDIAARGIDINWLRYVINYDIPNEPETYVHRIGRCGRAGKDGIAVSICEPEENEYIRDIEKLIQLKINRINDHPFPQTERPMTAQEKKDWNKEKERRKQEFFKNRKKARSGSASY